MLDQVPNLPEVDQSELYLTASGWTQLPSGRWKYPNLLLPGVARVRALNTSDAVELQTKWDEREDACD